MLISKLNKAQLLQLPGMQQYGNRSLRDIRSMVHQTIARTNIRRGWTVERWNQVQPQVVHIPEAPPKPNTERYIDRQQRLNDEIERLNAIGPVSSAGPTEDRKRYNRLSEQIEDKDRYKELFNIAVG